ncbi:MAG: type II secretion system GspH family protein [Fervidobacterium sp.]|nr:type II secretion system GspH family protein [Fervidobacterium sp.]
MRRGFTLIELLIVMSIIAALMSVATPVGINALQQAKATNVASNFRVLNQALIQMLTLEQNPPTSGDIIGYLVTNNYLSTHPQGFQIIYNQTEKAYVITYLNSDIDPLKVRALNQSVELDSNNKLILKVPRM